MSQRNERRIQAQREREEAERREKSQLIRETAKSVFNLEHQLESKKSEVEDLVRKLSDARDTLGVLLDLSSGVLSMRMIVCFEADVYYVLSITRKPLERYHSDYSYDITFERIYGFLTLPETSKQDV